MEVKNIKVGDKVRIRKDLPQEELVKLVEEHCIDREDLGNLQTRGEVTVRSIQEKNNKHGWVSIVLEEGLPYYWPAEIFEPVSKSKEEQVQEDIQKIKDIIRRYNLKNIMAGAADSLVGWLEQFGQDSLNKYMELKDIKVGDEVRLNQKLTKEEIEEYAYKYYLPENTQEYLQQARVVEAKQSRDEENDWDSVILKGDGHFWPVELFELVV